MSDAVRPKTAVTLAALAIFLVGFVIPRPGLDLFWQGLPPEAAIFPGGLVTWWERSSLFGPAIVPLLVVGLLQHLLAQAHPARARLIEWGAAATFLLLCAAVGLLQAVALQRIGRDPAAWELWHPPVVAEAGGRFLLLAVLTSAGGGAVLWRVARWVGRHGHAHGAIFFPGVVGLLYLLAEYPAGVQALQQGELWLIPLLDVAPVLIVLVALWWYGPHSWPRKLGPLGFRSAVEVALLPLALGTAADWVTAAAVERLLPAAAAELSSVSLLLSCGVALILGAQLRAGSGAQRAPIFGLAALIAVLPGLVLGGIQAVRVAEQALGPGRWGGKHQVLVVLVCRDEGATSSSEAQVLSRRLEVEGVKAEVSASADRRLRVLLHQVSDPQALLAHVLPPQRLRFHLVSRHPLPILDPEQMRAAGLTPEWREVQVPVGPSAASVLDAFSPGELPRGTWLAVECLEEHHHRGCRPWLLEEAVGLEGDRVVEASPSLNPDHHLMELSLRLDAEGALRFEELTADAVGRHLAIVLDDEILSVPRITARIPGGRLRLTLGNTFDQVASLQQAQALATALVTGPLQCRWQVEELTEVP